MVKRRKKVYEGARRSEVKGQEKIKDSRQGQDINPLLSRTFEF